MKNIEVIVKVQNSSDMQNLPHSNAVTIGRYACCKSYPLEIFPEGEETGEGCVRGFVIGSIQNMIKLHSCYMVIFTVFISILLAGCAKSSINNSEKAAGPETEKISETIDNQEEKDPERKNTEEKAKALKNTEDKAAKLAKKKLAGQKAKQDEIDNLKNNLMSVSNVLEGHSLRTGGHPTKKDKKAMQIAEKCLIKLNTGSLGFDKLSNANVTLLKAKALYLLQKDKEAIKILFKDWSRVVLPDKDLQKTGSLNKAPSAEGYYLKGQIYLQLARNESDKAQAKNLYKQAVRSYYAVLSIYDANKCIFSAKSVRGFTECRKEMQKKFKIQVGFPPEF